MKPSRRERRCAAHTSAAVTHGGRRTADSCGEKGEGEGECGYRDTMMMMMMCNGYKVKTKEHVADTKEERKQVRE